MTTISYSCLTCGTINKSGKLSCCARGGSWFGNCGATGNTNHQHTWYEGIQACKARQHRTAVMGQQENAVQQNTNDSTNDAGKIENFPTVISVANMYASTSAETPISGTTLFTLRAKAAIKMPTNRTMDTPVSNTVPARTFIAYDCGETLSKAITTTTFMAIWASC